VLRRIFFHHQRGYRSLAFLLVGLLAMAAYTTAVHVPDGSIPGWVLAARRNAVQTAIRGREVLAAARQAEGLPVNSGDTFQTGLIGVAESPITTDLGTLPSARTSTDPVFAAAVVQMLFDAGVHPGDVVAVGMTGSYPAFNMDALIGIEAVGARPVAIGSVGSTEYGANEPTFTWLDMEQALFDAGIIHERSIAVTGGGTLAGTGAARRLQIANRSGLPTLPVLPLGHDIRYRLDLYQQAAAEVGGHIAAFVNIGGASANVGSSSAESIITPGFSQPQWSQYQAAHLGIVGRMALERVPIIAMINMKVLSKTFGIPYDPALRPTDKDLAAPPAARWALAAALVFVIVLVVGFHRLGLFRVPDWELPVALRRYTRRAATPNTEGRDDVAQHATNGHQRREIAAAGSPMSNHPITENGEPR
jgi:poly-gamma-glutamate system protein